MEFDDYQEKARLTDQFPDTGSEQELMIPLLGLAGETGTLLSEFKKKIRDGESYEGFHDRAEEELGDTLWYLSNLASRLGLSLSTIAAKNLHKTEERWPITPRIPGDVEVFDRDYPEAEQLPRELAIEFAELETGRVQIRSVPDGNVLGETLTDNAYGDDGYRFHDVMHLAHLAMLGWSPVLRGLLHRKRKSHSAIDEVEDGARAAILEELIIAFVYSNARERKYYKGIEHVDSEMLGTIKRLVAHLEVGRRRTQDWERAILEGYKVFRHLIERKRAIVRVNQSDQSIDVVK